MQTTLNHILEKAPFIVVGVSVARCVSSERENEKKLKLFISYKG